MEGVSALFYDFLVPALHRAFAYSDGPAVEDLDFDMDRFIDELFDIKRGIIIQIPADAGGGFNGADQLGFIARMGNPLSPAAAAGLDDYRITDSLRLCRRLP